MWKTGLENLEGWENLTLLFALEKLSIFCDFLYFLLGVYERITIEDDLYEG